MQDLDGSAKHQRAAFVDPPSKGHPRQLKMFQQASWPVSRALTQNPLESQRSLVRLQVTPLWRVRRICPSLMSNVLPVLKITSDSLGMLL